MKELDEVLCCEVGVSFWIVLQGGSGRMKQSTSFPAEMLRYDFTKQNVDRPLLSQQGLNLKRDLKFPAQTSPVF